MNDEPRHLDQIQRWMQEVIMHPGGVLPGVDSPQAREEIDVPVERIETVIERSRALTSVERLEIYANAYYARLLECLREEFPILCGTVGEELFDEFAFGYLQTYPSRSYTLNHLGANFAKYLDETRPADESEAWPDFLIDLARLEWTFNEVFDGPGTEEQPLLDAAALASLEAERWPLARLKMAPCLRLLQLRYPLNGFYTEARRGENPAPPEPAETYLAVSRRDYVVRRHDLSHPQFELLAALAAGKNVGDAIAAAAESVDSEQLGEFADSLQGWFFQWAREGFFMAVEA